MSLLSRFLKSNKKNTASIAKERLQIIVAHQRNQLRTGPDYLPLLQKELIDVITKYVNIDRNQIKVEFEKDGEHSILELNVALPDD